VDLLDPEAVAPLLGCTPKTVEARLRDGTLPGVKLGRAWVIPARALEQRLFELALQQAQDRRAAMSAPPQREIFPTMAAARAERMRRMAAPELT